MDDFPPRPATPQVLLHRLPDKPDASQENARKPSKYIVVIMGSTAAAGKVQIATSVAQALGCPLFQGDSLHESSAKAASVGVAAGMKRNEQRYRRMWLSKLTRTGLLFPEESRPATEGFSGFGGASSTSTSRRGSASSVASGASSNPGLSSSVASPSRGGSMDLAHPPTPSKSALSATFTLSEEEKRRRGNPSLMVLTQPALEDWHRAAIRSSVGEYGLGVIFAPLYDDGTSGEGGKSDDDDDDDELPVLQPLDPRTMTSFPAPFVALAKKPRGWGSLDVEMKIRVNAEGDVESKTAEIIEQVRYVMGVGDGGGDEGV